MTVDALKPLLENSILTDDARAEIEKAWNANLAETKEQVKAQLREEYANKFDHDKTVMVEALDRMVTETLRTEISKIHAKSKKLDEDRVSLHARNLEMAKRFNAFAVAQLKEELTQFKNDRAVHNKALGKLERFVMHNLGNEITEFNEDKMALISAKTQLIAEAKQKMNEAKEAFIKRASVQLKEYVNKNLKAEISQLREDISAARKNDFGRKIYEAFASEFGATYLNENASLKALQAKLDEATKKLEEKAITESKLSKLVESKEREVAIIKSRAQREKILSEMLRSLNKDKAAVMTTLLESVETRNLQAAFNRYLPSVLSNDTKASNTRTVLSESVVTGDREVNRLGSEDSSEFADIRKLAGLQ